MGNFYSKCLSAKAQDADVDNIDAKKAVQVDVVVAQGVPCVQVESQTPQTMPRFEV
jgi:hypothetical protein